VTNIICEFIKNAYFTIGGHMKRISLQDYNKQMGTLIDLSSPETFIMEHHPDAVNFPYQKFMLYYDRYLNKSQPYYFICTKGIHSNKVVSMLEFFGYDVTQVVK